MIGLIASQIHITGNLEKDQQLLIYGIGGLIGLIVLAMIIIVVVVIVRRRRASRVVEIQAPVLTPPQADAYKPAEPEEIPPPQAKPFIIIDDTPEPVEEVTTPKRPEEPTPEPVAEVVKEPIPIPVQEETTSPKYDFGAYKEELAHQNPDDKMEEIRRRLEEIKRQRHTEPVPVLPKIEAKPTAVHDIAPATEMEHDPIVSEEEILAEDEMDETRPINEVPDPEAVSITDVPQIERLEPEEETTPVQEEAAEVPVPEEVPAPAEEEIPAHETTVNETAVHEEAVKKETVPEEPAVTPDEIHIGTETYYTTPNEPVMELQREPAEEPEPPVKEAPKTESALHPNGKFLPMKKLTFAEWVELFK